MNAVLAGGLANAAVVFATGVGFAWLHAIHGRSYLRSWAVGWLMASLGLTLSTVAQVHGMQWFTAPFPTLLSVASTILLAGAFSFVERPFPRGLLFVIVGLIAAGVVGTVFGPEPAFLLPSVAASQLGLAGVGVVLLSRRPRKRASTLAGVGFLLLSAHTLSFPVFAGDPGGLALGFMVATVLQVVIFAALVMMHYDSALLRIEQSEARYRGLFDNALVGVFQATPEGEILRANAALARMLGFDNAEALQTRVRMPELLSRSGDWERLADATEDARIEGEELGLRTQSGAELRAVVHARTTVGPDGQRRCEGMVQDVTEERALQRERAEARRIETVGTLASGVAHDFNNLLTVILSQLDLVRLDAGDVPEVEESLDAMQSAADQARRLTGQLLA